MASTDDPAKNADFAKQHGGGYGLGIIYAKTMFGGSENAHVTGVGTATREAKRHQAAE